MKASRKDAKTRRLLKSETVLLRQPVRNPLHTGLEQCRAKVDQQTEAFVCEAKLREHLFGMDSREFFDGFQFNDDEVLHNQVRAKTFFKDKVVIPDGDGHLPLHFKSSLPQLIGKDDFINRFEQSRPESVVNVKSRIDDHTGDFIFVHKVRQVADRIIRLQPLCAFASLREAFSPCRFWN